MEVVASTDVGGQLAEPEEQQDVAARRGDPHRTVMRGVAAVCAGIVAGALLPSSLEDGFSHGFPGEREQGIWTTFFWGEHWALRAAASWLATLGAGFLVGVLARRRGPEDVQSARGIARHGSGKGPGESQRDAERCRQIALPALAVSPRNGEVIGEIVESDYQHGRCLYMVRRSDVVLVAVAASRVAVLSRPNGS